MFGPVDNQLIVRLSAFDTQQDMFDLRREDIDAANDDHIVSAALDFAGSRAGPPALARLVRQGHDIPRPIADQWNALLGQRRKDQFTRLALGHRLACIGIDNLRVKHIGENMQAVLKRTFLRHTRTDDLAKPVNICRQHVPGLFDLAAHRLAPRFGSENTDVPTGRTRIKPDLLGLFSHIQRVTWRTGQNPRLEILHQLKLAFGLARRGRDDRQSHFQRPVMQP